MKITGNRTLSSRRWLDRQLNDPFVKQAKKDGFRSRAVYKLIEIDEKFQLLRHASNIADIGAAPGGWSQYIAQNTNENTKIVATDILEFRDIPKVQKIIGDFENEDVQHNVAAYFDDSGGLDLILSDMAPSTTGHSKTDHLRIMRLVELVYDFSFKFLKNNGVIVTKIFQGGDEKKFLDVVRPYFQKIYFFKPKSSRQESSEIYIVAIGFKKDLINVI